MEPLVGADWLNVDGEPIVYHQTDGDYLLYSFGLDGDDDGGIPAPCNLYGAPDNLYGDGDIQLQTHFAEPENADENDS